MRNICQLIIVALGSDREASGSFSFSILQVVVGLCQ
jgi:hypothetical protein